MSDSIDWQALDERYHARMAEISQPRPGRLRSPHWLRTSWSNWDGTGVYHADRDCPALRDLVEDSPRGGADLYELDLATGRAWQWRSRTRFRSTNPDGRHGWFRVSEEPMYSPGTLEEDVLEWLEQGIDPIESATDGAPDTTIRLGTGEWRACQRCGSGGRAQAATCARCWLAPCECDV